MPNSANKRVGGPGCNMLCPFSCYNIVLKCYGDLVLQLCPHIWTQVLEKESRKTLFDVRKLNSLLRPEPAFFIAPLLKVPITSFQQRKHLPAWKTHELSYSP